jgi:hypothetical protein
LEAIDDFALNRCVAKAADRRGKIQLDPGEELTELVVELARDARALLFPHLFDALR